VSSTEVSALFGLNQYVTAFELAVMKKAAAPDDREAGERADWGTRLQDAIAQGVSERYGVKVRAMNGYATHAASDAKMGASFDYEIIGLIDGATPENNVLREKYTLLGAGVLEIKNVDWLVFKQWDTDSGLEAPAHIEIQVQHQLACVGRKWAAIGVLIGGNKLELLIRNFDNAVAASLLKKCTAFWYNLDNGVMPPVELPADAALIASIYNYAEPGKVIDAQADDELTAIVKRYSEAAQAAKAADADKATAKAELLMRIGDAERVLVTGFTVSAGAVGEAEIPAYTRKGYRNVRITAKKESKS
jgi:predicted phage-related endonuclease